MELGRTMKGLVLFVCFVFILCWRELPMLKNNNSADRKWLHIQEKGRGLSTRAQSLSRLAFMGPKQRYEDWP